MIEDNEFPDTLRDLADKLHEDFKKNIYECKDELYEISCDLVMRFEELEDIKLEEYKRTAKAPEELQEWINNI